MDHVGVVVEDFEAATVFFLQLGLEPESEGVVEGNWLYRVVGLDDVGVGIATMRTPDGHGWLELTKFHTRPATTTGPDAPANTLSLPTGCWYKRLACALRAGTLAGSLSSPSETLGTTARDATRASIRQLPDESREAWLPRRPAGHGHPDSAPAAERGEGTTPWSGGSVGLVPRPTMGAHTRNQSPWSSASVALSRPAKLVGCRRYLASFLTDRGSWRKKALSNVSRGGHRDTGCSTLHWSIPHWSQKPHCSNTPTLGRRFTPSRDLRKPRVGSESTAH